MFIARSRLALVAVCAWAAWLVVPSSAWAWKPKTHVHLAEVARDDALDGKLTIFATNYASGTLQRDTANNPVVLGTYNVHPAVLAALRDHPAQFRAGVLGPDAYPDIATGQQIIHPAGVQGNGETNRDINDDGPGPDPWLRHLWNLAYGANGTPDSTGPCRAFVAGFATHAAGDIYGHTLINHYTGDAFHFLPKPENAIKHLVVEGHVGKMTKNPVYDAQIAGGVSEFIYRNMVEARPNSAVAALLTGKNKNLSVPVLFATIRARLQTDIDNYNNDLADFDRRIARANFAQKIALEAEKAAYRTANGLQTTYKEHWVEDIDNGLKAWPQLSHDIALALFFNPADKADLDAAKARFDRYTNDHLLSMLGAPDFVGASRAVVGRWIDAVLNAIGIPAIKEAYQALKTSLYDFVLKSTFGLTTADLKKYLDDPTTQFDPVMTNPAFFTEGGTQITRANFDAQELKLNGATVFEYENVPAAYNTVVLTKMLMMEPSEVNRLMHDLGTSLNLSQPSAILGFAGTLDGSNQWSVNDQKMIAAQDVAAYRKIFLRQSGEKP